MHRKKHPTCLEVLLRVRYCIAFVTREKRGSGGAEEQAGGTQTPEAALAPQVPPAPPCWLPWEAQVRPHPQRTAHLPRPREAGAPPPGETLAGGGSGETCTVKDP